MLRCGILDTYRRVIGRKLRISIVTAVYNRAATIESTIKSVLGQQNVEIEYIVVDGNSSDGTTEIIRSYSSHIATCICEPDTGIYNAINKGILAATGDVVGFLHGDDLLGHSNVVGNVARAFSSPIVDALYGDLVYVDQFNVESVVRYWKSKPFHREKFRWGWMPPHPTFYLRRRHHDEYGLYREDFDISADYELMLRMLYRHKLNAVYSDDLMIRMRVGGKSNVSIRNKLKANREDQLAWSVNGLRIPRGLRIIKPVRKLVQYFVRPKTATKK